MIKIKKAEREHKNLRIKDITYTKTEIFTPKRKIYTILFVIFTSVSLWFCQANKKSEEINSDIGYQEFRSRMQKLEYTLTYQVTFLSAFPFTEKYLLNSFIKEISAQTVEIVKITHSTSVYPMVRFPDGPPRGLAEVFGEIYSNFTMFYYKGIEHFDDDFSFNNNVDKLRYWKEFVKERNDKLDFLDNYYENQKKMENIEKYSPK